MNDAPTSWHLERVISLAMSAVETLRTEHGQVIETGDEILAALAEEGVDVDTILRRLVRASLDAKAMAAAADDRIDDLRARKDRFSRQQEAYRTTVLEVMSALGLKTFKDPEFSLSISAGKPKLMITDETTLPESMFDVMIVRSPNKASIKTALEGGQDVPGAMLGNAAPVLTVRTK